VFLPPPSAFQRTGDENPSRTGGTAENLGCRGSATLSEAGFLSGSEMHAFWTFTQNRSATSGSTRVARRAGNQHAATPAARSCDTSHDRLTRTGSGCARCEHARFAVCDYCVHRRGVCSMLAGLDECNNVNLASESGVRSHDLGLSSGVRYDARRRCGGMLVPGPARDTSGSLVALRFE